MKDPSPPPVTARPPLPEPVRPRRKGIYVLPNAVTLAALFSGFYAIVMAMSGRFEVACIGIFAAAVLDSLDGRIARMTHTQSAFGEQMDSLCDMVSFGAAPALIVYEWALKDMGKAGWIPAFVYIAGAALRLARFNSNIGVVDKRFFQGLPSPAAAALIAGFVWLAIDNKIPVRDSVMPWVAFGLTVYTGLTMVSSAPFYSGKSFQLARSVPFWVMGALIVVIFVVSSDPPIALFSLFCLYALSGYVYWAWQFFRGQPNPAKPVRDGDRSG